MIVTFLRHGSNAVLASLVLLGALAAGAGLLQPRWLLVPLGALLFFGSEYGWHRFAFHAPPMGARPLRRLQHRLHYDHHAEPDRLDLLFLPLWFLLPNLLITGALAFAIWHNLAAAASLVAGAILGILYYEWVHYVAHIPYRPRTRFGCSIKKYHLWHHYKNEQLWFGVTNPLFDVAMRTYTTVEQAARSRTTRNLHGR